MAHLSYFIGSEDEAIVIDPRRDCQLYVDLAFEMGLKIKYIFETHRNEDYVIGSLELANLTGAEIYHGKYLDFKYGNNVKDGDVFYFGSLKLTAIHTPGHTDESMSYLLSELETGDEGIMVFTGDTLFIGDTGRTDLYGPDDASRLAGNMYDSIFNKLLPIGDHVILCPAHGAGSICGGSISEREQSTLGIERRKNPSLQVENKDEFVDLKNSEHHYIPHYFKKMEEYNLKGAPLMEPTYPLSLSTQEFKQHINDGAVILDTREPVSFAGAHIKGSYNIWIEGIPAFAGWVLSYQKPILLTMEEKEHLETVTRYLLRLGFDNIKGYLKEGIESWYNEGLKIEKSWLMDVHRLNDEIKNNKLTVLDVRRNDEWEKGHIENAVHIYVGELENRINELPTNKPIAVVCNVGRRASLAVSILKRNGFDEVYNVLGSMTAWENANYKMLK
ncbi:MAG: MBL fold metallo-hydrolase [Methanohalobium sp.]|uniref:MBL fold metallo-hydrolase n=1 Tax=Methanohalobium sp. TaxID=2837493 RepID=UPI00397D1D40